MTVIAIVCVGGTGEAKISKDLEGTARPGHALLSCKQLLTSHILSEVLLWGLQRYQPLSQTSGDMDMQSYSSHYIPQVNFSHLHFPFLVRRRIPGLHISLIIHLHNNPMK